MTDKTKRWGFVFVAIAVIYIVFYGSTENAYQIGSVVGGIIGMLVMGGFVAFILKFFWKKHTGYELWMASSSIFGGLVILGEFFNTQG